MSDDKARIAELKAENASLKGDLESHLWAGDRVVDAEARAERAEAACAEMREALEIAERALSTSPATYEYDLPPVRAALSTTCGERYARIVEAAEKAKAYADKWGGDVNLALVNKIFESLAAKEPSEEEKP